MTTSKILGLTVAAALIQSCKICNAFLSPVSISRHQPSSLSNRQPISPTQLHDVKIMDDSGGSPDAPKNSQEDAALQWDLFTRHHAQDGEWWGTWTTYNYMGDMVDSTVGG